MIETPAADELFRPAHLKRIEALQAYVETLPHVKGATSIVDSIKQMNRAMHADRHEAYRLPDSANLVAQYMLLYSANGQPTDFEQAIDYDNRLRNVRVRLDSGLFQHEKGVILAIERYLRETFTAAGIRAYLSGRVNVDYHWVKELARSHFRSLALSLIAVWFMAFLSFRSATAGIFCLLPVSLSVLFIYAVMGFTGIWLGVGTVMTAAIAIGIAVDFAIHSLDRVILLTSRERHSLEEAFTIMYPSTGRALLFNFSAVFLGFLVFTTSHVPPIIRFGSLVAAAVCVSFLATQTLLPALLQVVRPAFLGLPPQTATAPVEPPEIPIDNPSPFTAQK